MMDAHTIRVDYSKQRTHYLALFSDVHLEDDDCDRAAFKRDREEARRLGARMLFNGDLASLILPSDAKRFTSGKHSRQYDAIIDLTARDIAEELKEDADLIDVIGEGNHETAVLKYHHADLILQVIGKLSQYRSKSLPPIHHGGYKGFTRYLFHHGDNCRVRSYVVYRFHGTGGGAPVTKGMIDINRIRATYRADLYWIGHKHTSIDDTGLVEIGMNAAGDICSRRLKAVVTAGYKLPFQQRDYSDGYILDYSDQQLTAQASGHAIVQLSIEQNGIRSRLIKE
jgi:hypothetical protein